MSERPHRHAPFRSELITPRVNPPRAIDRGSAPAHHERQRLTSREDLKASDQEQARDRVRVRGRERRDLGELKAPRPEGMIYGKHKRHRARREIAFHRDEVMDAHGTPPRADTPREDQR